MSSQQHHPVPSSTARYRYTRKGKANEPASLKRFRDRLRQFTFEITGLDGETLEASAFVTVRAIENGEYFQWVPLTSLERIREAKNPEVKKQLRPLGGNATLFGVAA